VLLEGDSEELGAIDTLDSGVTEALGPTDEDTVVDLFLPRLTNGSEGGKMERGKSEGIGLRKKRGQMLIRLEGLARKIRTDEQG
jgi:hypothetical protein